MNNEPISIDLQIRFLFEEKREMRTEMVAYQQGQQNATLAFVVFFGTLAGLYANPAMISNAPLRSVLLFIGTQVIYFLGIYLLSQMAVLSAHAGYVAALENRINHIAGTPLSLWETIGSPRYAWRGPMILAFAVMGLLMLAAWIFCIYLILTEIPKCILIAVISAESLLLLILLLLGFRENPRVGIGMINAFKSHIPTTG